MAEGGGFIVGEARVRLRPSTATFAAEAHAGIDPALAGIEGRIAGSSSRIHTGLLGLSRNLAGFGVPFVGALGSVDTAMLSSERRAGGFATTLGRLGRVEAMAAGVGIAIAASQLTKFVNEGRESERVGRLTEAVLKSTGGVARVTADDVSTLADSLSRKAGVDDEIIQSGENVLLTFTRVRNEAGAGNDIFNQGTQAALDMSAAMHQELQPSIVQIGKALQDPIAGVTALQRIGVRLTETQKEQVKAFVESGDILSAQKIILHELQVEFGGAAAANADWFDKLGVATENLQEKVGMALIPQIIRLGETTGALFGRLQDVNDATGGWAGKVTLGVAALPVLAFGMEKLSGAGAAVGGAFDKAAAGLGRAVTGTAAAVTSSEQLALAESKVASASAQRELAAARLPALQAATSAATVRASLAARELTAATTAVAGADNVEAGALRRLEVAKAGAIAANAELIASERALGTATTTVSTQTTASAGRFAALGAVLPQVVGSLFAVRQINLALKNDLGASSDETSALVNNLVTLAETGRSSGALVEEFGVNFKDLAQSMEDARGVSQGVQGQIKRFNDLFGGDPGDKYAQPVKNLTDALLRLNQTNPTAAIASFQNIKAHLIANGQTAEQVDRAFKKLEETIGGMTGPVDKTTQAQANLTDAQAKFSRDILSHKGPKVLAADYEAVAAASAVVAGAQGKVNAATAAGAARVDAASTATDKYSVALKTFNSDAASGNTRIGQLASGWDAVIAAASNSASTQRQLTSVLNATGLAAVSAAGDVISLAMAEAALGDFSANAVTSAKNLSDVAFRQYDAQTAVQTSTEAYAAAVDALSESQDGGGGGGAAGATQTATAMMIEQTSKALALSDALRSEEQTARQIVEAQESLTQAREDARDATDEVTAAETKLERVLRGVSAASRQARDASEDLTRARLDSRSRALDQNDAERELADAQQKAKDDAVANAESIKAAELALQDARASHDPTVIAAAEAALKDARAAAAKLEVEDDAKVQRAEIRLAESKLATADATEAQNEAQRVYHGTLHGFPPASEEARSAQDDLTAAQDRARDAADAVTAAQRSLSDAQYQTAASALAVKRAQADVRGELESIPAAAGGAVKAFDRTKEKMHEVRAAAIQLAEHTRDAVAQSTGYVGDAIIAQVEKLRQLTAANPLLKGAFDQVLTNLMHEIGILGPSAFSPVTPETLGVGIPRPTGLTFGLNPSGRAGGGDIAPDEWVWVGEEGPELAKGLTGGGARVYSNPQSVAIVGDSLSSRSRMEIEPAPLQSAAGSYAGAHGSSPSAAEIAAALAPYMKPDVHVHVTGEFVALNPDELASESARQLAGRIASTGQGIPF